MHAIIETGGKQYRVAPGDVVRVEKLPGEAGSEVELAAKAAFSDSGELVSGATVKATIAQTKLWSSSSSARINTKRRAAIGSTSPN